jgi:hypothetical protein
MKIKRFIKTFYGEMIFFSIGLVGLIMLMGHTNSYVPNGVVPKMKAPMPVWEIITEDGYCSVVTRSPNGLVEESWYDGEQLEECLYWIGHQDSD